MRKILPLLFASLLAACVGIPENIKPVQGFDAQRYLGRWHEIARLENRFETGLEQINANYSLRDDGGLRVLNRGYDPAKQAWQEAEGKAYFVGPASEGSLKVSFFGPFYGAYNVIDLDENYGYALVCGQDYSYLWILARMPSLPDAVLGKLIAKAKGLGFATDKLIYVKQ
ncbi:MAG: lipocalin family protein [Candidatus Methylumidiphilus sp.]